MYNSVYKHFLEAWQRKDGKWYARVNGKVKQVAEPKKSDTSKKISSSNDNSSNIDSKIEDILDQMESLNEEKRDWEKDLDSAEDKKSKVIYKTHIDSLNKKIAVLAKQLKELRSKTRKN